MARICQHVNQVVIALHFRMRDATREYDTLGQTESLGLCPERSVLRPTSHKQQPHGRVAPQQRGQGIKQQIQALV